MKKYLILYWLLFLVIFVLNNLVSNEAEAQNNTPFLHQLNSQEKHSTSSLIETAFAKGQINLDEKILYHVYSIFDRIKLPLEFLSTTPERCGTWIFDEIRRNWENLNESTKQILSAYGIKPPGILARPTGLDSSRSTTHFKIHYSMTPGDTNAVSTLDSDGNGTPDYVDQVMIVLEQVRSYEITTMGYYPPPSDSTAGGDSKYDVYIYMIGNFYGYVTRESKIGDNPNSPSVNEINAYTSYMGLRNNYYGFPLNELATIQVTSAHEFYHSIQNGYDGWEKSWLKEATATWCEDEVYDDVNDNYQYLTNWFARPWIPLDATKTESSGHWYGSWIFFRYISEHEGGRNTVRRIWEKCIDFVDGPTTDFSFYAIEDALTERGTTFQNVFRGFTTANFFPSLRYEEGANYPKVTTSGLMVGDITIEDSLFRRASKYYLVSPNILPKGNDVIYFTFTPLDANTQFGVQVVTRKHSTVTISQFANNYSLSNTKDLDEIAVIVMNFSTTGTTNKFQLRVQTNSSIHRVSHVPVQYAEDMTLSFSNGQVSWVGSDYNLLGPDYNLYYYDGKNVWKIVTRIFLDWLQKPELHNGQAVWLDYHKWNEYRVTPVVKYFNSKTTQTIGSPDWSVDIGPDRGHPTVFIHDGKIVFCIYDLVNPRRSLVMSNSGSPIVNISPTFLTPHNLHQTNSGQVIWSTIDTVYWYNGSTNVLPPTRLRNTIPKLDKGKMAWSETYSDDPYPHEYTWEMFYYDGNSTVRVTNDTLRDGWYHHLFDFKNEKIAWIRSMTAWWGDGSFTNFYSDGNIKVLRDSITHLPHAGDWPMIDEKKNYVVWRGYSTVTYDAQNLFLYDGKSIVPIVPSTLRIAAGAWAIDNGQVAFAAWPQSGGDLAIYVYTHDTTLTSVGEESIFEEKVFSLSQNYPNPFNSSTTIKFSLAEKSKVTLKIYNILGQEVEALINEERDGGVHTIQWNPKTLSSGVYFYQIKAKDYIESKKLILLK